MILETLLCVCVHVSVRVCLQTTTRVRSVWHSPSLTGRASDTLPMRLGERPTLSQCGWESIGHTPSVAGRVSDTLPMRLGKYRILSQCSWESVGHSPNAGGRVSDNLLVRPGECRSLSQCGWQSDRNSPNAANVRACVRARTRARVYLKWPLLFHLCHIQLYSDNNWHCSSGLSGTLNGWLF